jgi:PAS domain S-box-containing protein
VRDQKTAVSDARRQNAEQARQAQDVDAIPTLAWSARPDGSAEFLTRRWLEYTGLSAEEASDWSLTAAVHTEDRDKRMDFWRHLLTSGEAGEIEARLRRHDGDYRWFLFRVEPVRDNHGNIFKWYGANTDIEDRKRAEALLAAEKRTLKMIASGACLAQGVQEREHFLWKLVCGAAAHVAEQQRYRISRMFLLRAET